MRERDLDIVIDHLHTLNDLTPKIRVSKEKGVDPNLIFGLDSKLFSDAKEQEKWKQDHNEEVQTMTVHIGTTSVHNHDGCDGHHNCEGQDFAHGHPASTESVEITEASLDAALALLPKESVWRVKGFVRFSPSGDTKILNWAFGRYELSNHITDQIHIIPPIKLTVMGQRGEMKRFAKRFADKLGAELST